MREGNVVWPHQLEEREILEDIEPVDYPSCKVCAADVTLGFIYIKNIGSLCQSCYDEVMEALGAQLAPVEEEVEDVDELFDGEYEEEEEA